MKVFFRSFVAVLMIVALLSAGTVAGQEAGQQIPGNESWEIPPFDDPHMDEGDLDGVIAQMPADCTFLRNPQEFMQSVELHRMEVSRMTEAVGSQIKANPTQSALQGAETVARTPRKNFIDEYIFDRMERDGVKPAPPATDIEFLRRVYFDFTGKPPAPNDLFAFVADTNPNKRDAVIDKLAWSYDFIDKWVMFFGDLYKNNSTAANVTRYQQGRDSFNSYLYQAIGANKPYDEMVRELISGEGDNFVPLRCFSELMSSTACSVMTECGIWIH
jgi:hypothetical protein